MIIIIDNFDSFTYNLVNLVGRLEPGLQVYRNNAIDVGAISRLRPDGIIISPGPGRPAHAGCTNSVIESFCRAVPILGVCLGHQCIAEVFGAGIIAAGEPVHGKVSEISHNGLGLFRGIPSPFKATRYHSLIVDASTLGGEFEQTAFSADGTLMGIAHRTYPLRGVQFHPEAILTEYGFTILENWVRYDVRDAAIAREGSVSANPEPRPITGTIRE